MNILYNFKYYLFFIKSRAFLKNPIKLFYRGIILFLLIIFKINKTFKINFGTSNFVFNFVPLNKNWGGRGIFLYREKIESLMEFGHNLININDICIDAGANQGIYSLAFSSKVKNFGKIYAIEPMSYAVNLIKENKKINHYKNIIIIKKVLADKKKIYTLDTSLGPGSASITKIYKNNNNKMKISSTTIDEIVKKYNLKRLNFIKLDIEGAEILALKGAKNSLIEFSPIISIESNVNNFFKLNNYLKEFKYHPFLFNDSGKLKRIYKITKTEACIIFKKVN